MSTSNSSVRRPMARVRLTRRIMRSDDSGAKDYFLGWPLVFVFLLVAALAWVISLVPFSAPGDRSKKDESWMKRILRSISTTDSQDKPMADIPGWTTFGRFPIRLADVLPNRHWCFASQDASREILLCPIPQQPCTHKYTWSE